ncbi:MAG: hypothetical protein LWX83_15630 [Anaerolineae bacterium]|nr:hypothetical protein [Anaerolineae bacterium]
MKDQPDLSINSHELYDQRLNLRIFPKLKKTYHRPRTHNSGNVDFSLRVDTELDMFGPKVLVVIQTFSGEEYKEWMPVCMATDFVLRNPALGVSIKSAHIEYNGVYDEWGHSF